MSILSLLFSKKTPEPLRKGSYSNPSQGIGDSFQEHYLKYIKPKEVEFEDKRLKALKSCKKRFIITVLAFIALTALFFKGSELPIEFIFGTGFVLFLWSEAPKKKYSQKIKTDIFPLIFKFFKSLEYSLESKINIKQLQNDSKIIAKHSRCTLEDSIKGEIKGVSLDFCAAHLQDIDHFRKYNTMKTVFKGLFVSFVANKNFSSKTIIKTDGGTMGNFFDRKASDYENVKLEDPIFEKEFEVYSSDQVEARYLLTTAFMENLLELSKLFSGSVQCSFFDNQIFITLETNKSFFEVCSIKEPVNFLNDANIIFKEIEIFGKIIDTLNLDSKTRT